MQKEKGLSSAPFEEAVGGSTLNGLGVRFGSECLGGA
jgi:hypothetical protein